MQAEFNRPSCIAHIANRYLTQSRQEFVRLSNLSADIRSNISRITTAVCIRDEVYYFLQALGKVVRNEILTGNITYKNKKESIAEWMNLMRVLMLEFSSEEYYVYDLIGHNLISDTIEYTLKRHLRVHMSKYMTCKYCVSEVFFRNVGEYKHCLALGSGCSICNNYKENFLSKSITNKIIDRFKDNKYVLEAKKFKP